VKRTVFSLVSIALLALCVGAFADTFRYDNIQPGLREVGFQTGFGENLQIPDFVKRHFQFGSLKLRYARYTTPRSQIAFELNAGEELYNQYGWAVSSVVSHRQNFLVHGGTALGYGLGFGLVDFFNGVPELGSKLNFTEQLCLTFQYATSHDSALTIEYQFNHASNAGLKLPNIGLNTNFFSIGHAWYR